MCYSKHMKFIDHLLRRKPKQESTKEASKPEIKPEPKKTDTQTITLSLDDTVIQRAEKIIWATGLRGATGDFIYSVASVLDKYNSMEQAQKRLLEIEVEGLRKQVAEFHRKEEEKKAKRKAKKDSKNGRK